MKVRIIGPSRHGAVGAIVTVPHALGVQLTCRGEAALVSYEDDQPRRAPSRVREVAPLRTPKEKPPDDDEE